MWNPFARIHRKIELPADGSRVPTMTVDDMPFVASTFATPTVRTAYWDGEKFPGGFGATDLLSLDYWTLRKRSGELFRKNIYGRGVIRRLITNEINTGLHLEATPVESVLDLEDDALADWSDDIETRFELWASDPLSCDWRAQWSFGAMQQIARRESLVDGDVLAVLMQDARTKLPRLHLISGDAVRQPMKATGTGKLSNGNRVVHGVELDKDGRHVAFWIAVDGEERRLDAYGKTGRKLAWLVYGTDNRLNDVRGEPLLSLILQSLKEIDRFRDSSQRAAFVQSTIALWIERQEAKASSAILSGGATVRGSETVVDQTNQPRTFNMAELYPGAMVEQLQHGEKIHGFSPNVVSEKFGEFESAIIYAVAWHLEIPPEILTLSFQSNYSASQAALQEFKLYLERIRPWFAEQVCRPVYQEWLLSSVLMQRRDAAGMVDAWRDPLARDRFVAWAHSDWSGQIKPSVDAVKAVNAEILKLEHGLTTYDRAARELTGTKFARNAKRQVREVALLVAARKGMADLQATPGGDVQDDNPDQRDEEEQREQTGAALRVLRPE